MAAANTGIDITPRRIRALLPAIVTALFVLSGPLPASAQDVASPRAEGDDTRTQYPVLLRNSYFSLNLGYIDYGFTEAQLDPGFTAGSIETPRIAVRAILIGHQFLPWLSVQAHYARPVLYASYHDINGEPGR